MGKVILETKGLKNDVTTKLVKDIRQPFFILEEINDKFKLVVDIKHY